MMSVPFSSTSPENSAVGGSRPSRASTVVLLPHPDSPTSPARSAASRVKLTPRTACTSAACGGSNQTCRPDTSSRLIWRPGPRPTSGRSRHGRIDR